MYNLIELDDRYNYSLAVEYFVNSNIPNYEFVRHLTNDRTELHSQKCLWQGFAEVLVKRGLPKVKDVIKEMLMWYQDANWPGFITIHNFIFEHKEELKDEILTAYQEAKLTNDYSWIEWLEEFLGVQLWT